MKKYFLLMLVGLLIIPPPAVYAMHISDGVLSLQLSGLWFLLCLPFVALGIREIKKRQQADPDYFPLLAMIGVAVFILSVFHIPVPVAGSCSHPTGGALAAIVVGPFAAVVINMLALLFQAVFLAHGGIVVWGANTFSMGIAGVLIGYAVYRLLRLTSLSPWTAAACAGFVADLATYGVAGLQLALDLHGSAGVLPSWKLYALGYLPTQLPLAIIDGVLTGFMVKYISQNRPDLAQKFFMGNPVSLKGTSNG